MNTRYRAANAFFKWLISEGEARENPVDRIEPPSVPETVQPHYTPEAVQSLLKALNGRRLKGVDAFDESNGLLLDAVVETDPAKWQAAGELASKGAAL